MEEWKKRPFAGSHRKHHVRKRKSKPTVPYIKPPPVFYAIGYQYDENGDKHSFVISDLPSERRDAIRVAKALARRNRMTFESLHVQGTIAPKSGVKPIHHKHKY